MAGRIVGIQLNGFRQFLLTGGPIQVEDGASLRVRATIIDKDGNILGELEETCEKALAAWEAEFKKVGLNL